MQTTPCVGLSPTTRRPSPDSVLIQTLHDIIPIVDCVQVGLQQFLLTLPLSACLQFLCTRQERPLSQLQVSTSPLGYCLHPAQASPSHRPEFDYPHTRVHLTSLRKHLAAESGEFPSETIIPGRQTASEGHLGAGAQSVGLCTARDQQKSRCSLSSPGLFMRCRSSISMFHCCSSSFCCFILEETTEVMSYAPPRSRAEFF